MKVKELVLNALFIALVFVATRFIAITTPYGYFHAGDGIFFAIAIVFGLKSGVLAAGIGMGLSDFFSPYIVYTVPTLIIKSVMVIIIVVLVKKINNEKLNIIPMVLAGLVGVLGYFTFEFFYYNDLAAALSMVVPNILQSCVVAPLLATVLVPLLKRIK